MRNVVFVAPFPLPTTMEFVAALAALDGIRLTIVFQEAPPRIPGVAEVVHCPSVLDPRALLATVREIARYHGPVHRLLGVLEELQGALAFVREQLQIEGLGVEATESFRDKARMKEVLREAGLPCARHRRIHGMADAWSFLDEVGFPIVLKPPAGAGCRATWRVSNLEELRAALNEYQPSLDRPALAEEFLVGAEHSFDTLTLKGEVRFHSIGRYYPGPLEVMENPWVQWVVHLPRDISGPEFDDVRALGPRVIEALGLKTGMTHMEWFRRTDGSLAVGEIAARPPGARFVPLIGQAHDADMFRAWARLVVDEVVTPLRRQYSAGVAFLRGQGEGRVAGVDGLDEAQRRIGHLVVASKLPQTGAPRSSGYEGEGWVILRDRDSDLVKHALLDLITTVRVRYA